MFNCYVPVVHYYWQLASSHWLDFLSSVGPVMHTQHIHLQLWWNEVITHLIIFSGFQSSSHISDDVYGCCSNNRYIDCSIRVLPMLLLSSSFNG